MAKRSKESHAPIVSDPAPLRTPHTWTPEQSAFFRRLYTHMTGNPEVFVFPPGAGRDVHWDATAWNCAYVATVMLGRCPPLAHFNAAGTLLATERPAGPVH